MATGRVHSFETFGAVDGPGVRFIVFLQGCPLRCLYCHNPDSWSINRGADYSVEEVVAKILPYRSFYANGGVTVSGGEPMMQPEFTARLCKALKNEGLHTAIDTSGGVPLWLCRKAVDAADMLLLDIKSGDADMSRRITGKSDVLSNEKEYLDYCEITCKKVWIRHVAVPGLTLEEDRLQRLADMLRPYKCVERIEVLPFHKLGEHKWGKGYTLADTPVPTAEEMALAERILKK